MEKELLELHGLLLDRTYYLDRGKYLHIVLFNFDINLMNRFWKSCLLEKNSVIERNNKRQFIKSECKWRLKNSLTKEQIITSPKVF